MRKHMKVALICIALVVAICSLQIGAFAMEFNDVYVTDSYCMAVDRLSNKGVIQGRGDGNFYPNDNTTRAEICTFIARANNYNAAYYSNLTTPFTDVSKGNWAEPYISYCYENNFVNGMDAESFAPNNNVTYEQAIKIAVCAAGLENKDLSAVGPHWYSGYIAQAKKSGLLNETQNGEVSEIKYEIGKPAPRSFVALLIDNAMTIKEKNQEKNGGSDAIDVSGNRHSSGTVAETTPVVYEDGPMWQPTQEDEVWKYYQYYGEDYEKYMKEDENNEKYTLPEEEEDDDYEYIPVGSSEGMLIVIDPGHNYNTVDTGAVGNGLREQDITFYIAEKLRDELVRNGFQVIMTRNSLKDNVSTESVSKSLARRSEIANRNGADLFVSIHCNAGGGTGTETYYCTGSDSGRVFAKFIQEGMLDAVGLRDRGVKNARYAVLRNSNMTAALLETGFIDSAHDAKYLGSDEYQQKFAEGIAKGICDYVGIEFK